MIGISVRADGAAVAARLGTLPGALRDRLRTLMERLSRALHAQVEDRLSGGALQTRSGTLAAGIAQEVEDTGIQITATVGDGRRAPYAAALEFGATTRARLIEAKNAKALAFAVAGRPVFARRMHHLGSRIPAHSFLRASLAEMEGDAAARIAAAVTEVTS